LEEKGIVANSLTLWMCCLSHNSGLFDEFLKFPKVDELVMAGILYCNEENIR
jgi:hypothetical protein